MLTRHRPALPILTGDWKVDGPALLRALNDHWLKLETKGALVINEAEITANQGIKFPATQVASSDANTLDDYEEVTNQAITVTSGTGTITTVGTATINYTKVGREVLWQSIITITTNGTGATDVRFTFPFTVVGIAPFHGFDTAQTFSLTGYINGTTALFYKYDGTYPGANGATFRLRGVATV